MRDTGYAGQAGKYIRNYSSMISPRKVRFLGELEGSWFEIGSSYAEGACDYIRIVYDDTYEQLVNLFGRQHLLKDLRKYENAISNFSIQAKNFMGGVAEGAKEVFSQSEHSKACTDNVKVLMMCCRNELLFRHPEYCVNGAVRARAYGNEGCSAFAVNGVDGGAIRDETIVAHNNDGRYGLLLNVAYVAVPDDCEANSFWSLGLAGQPTFSQANDKGLTIIETAGGVNDPLENAFGVPWQVIAWHAIAYSRSVEEATKIITCGTERYASRTGKTSLLRTGGCNYLLADDASLKVIETSANRYSIRLPGDLNEGGEYIVLTNHNFMNQSYDEKSNYSNNSMVYGTPPGSDMRFWTLMHLIKRNFGYIDEGMAQGFMSTHLVYDKEGQQPVDERKGVPANLSETHSTTPCAHEGGYPEKYVGGTEESKVLSIQGGEVKINYVQGRPCEWRGEWDTYVLKRMN